MEAKSRFDCPRADADRARSRKTCVGRFEAGILRWHAPVDEVERGTTPARIFRGGGRLYGSIDYCLGNGGRCPGVKKEQWETEIYQPSPGKRRLLLDVPCNLPSSHLKISFGARTGFPVYWMPTSP